MKFVVLFVFVLIANPQYAFGDEEAVVVENVGLFGGLLSNVKNTAQNIKDRMANRFDGGAEKIIKSIPGAETLIKTVNALASIPRATTTVFRDTLKIIDAFRTGGTGSALNVALNVTGIADRLNNTLLPLPISVNGTNIGNAINNISNGLSEGTRVLTNVVGSVNNSFNAVTNAGQNFLIKTIGRLSPKLNSTCWASLTETNQNFTGILIENAKVCVYNVMKTVDYHITKLESMQKELNSAIQLGWLRASIFSDISTEMIAIPADLLLIQESFPICQSTQLIQTLTTVAPLVASWSSTCFSAVVKGN